METLKVEQCDREAAWHYAGFHCLPDRQMREQWFSGYYDNNEQGAAIRAFARHRIAERERCAGIAKTGWVSADYNIVGIADADVAMRLCEHIETAIREQSNGA